ncbi:MAG: hypothetical protein HY547_04040 [Elusimicrobia bacterium]|nr:hypothetical protein [Elusimicrobiota bacterium]
MALFSFIFLTPILGLTPAKAADRREAVSWAESCLAEAPLIVEMKHVAGVNFAAEAWNQACLKLEEPCRSVLQNPEERNAMERCRNQCLSMAPTPKKGQTQHIDPKNPCTEISVLPGPPQQSPVIPREMNLDYLTMERINRIIYFAARDPEQFDAYQYQINGEDPFSRHHYVACHAWQVSADERDHGDSWERALRNAEYYLYSYCHAGQSSKSLWAYFECEKAHVYDLAKYSDWFRDSDLVSAPGKTPPGADAVEWACMGAFRAADNRPPEFDRKLQQK